MKALLVLSGGMDSTTLLYDLIDQRYEINVITFDYNQKHKKEIKCAIITCENLGIPQKIVDISFLNDLAPSCLTREKWEVPEGNYNEDSMKQTVVPNRNMVLLSISAAYAIGSGFSHLFYAAHAGDHIIYPDCRPVFVSAMSTVLHLCDWTDVTLHTPYLYLTKKDILHKGLKLGVDYSNTWTCYKGEDLSCGQCGSCTERLEAFIKLGIKDPLKYQSNS